MKERNKKKKKKKGNTLAARQPSGLVLLQCSFVSLGVLLVMKALKDVNGRLL